MGCALRVPPVGRGDMHGPPMWAMSDFQWGLLQHAMAERMRASLQTLAPRRSVVPIGDSRCHLEAIRSQQGLSLPNLTILHCTACL